MSSPDFRQYVDLTVYDQQPGDIYSDAIDYGISALPEFSVRQGTVEDALLQSMSYVSGQTIAAINRLPDGLMQGLLDLMGFNRIESELATGLVYFTVIDNTGITIPPGVVVGYTEEVEGGTVLHLFRTLTSAIAVEGETQTSAVAIEALDPGEKPPLIAGTPMTIFTNFAKLHQAFLNTNITQGGAQETDEQYFSRAVTYLASLSTGLVTVNQINAYVAFAYKQAIRSKAYDLTNLYSVVPVSLARSSNTVTATLTSSQIGLSGVATGDVIRVHSANSAFNGCFIVTAVTLTQVEWSQSGADASSTPVGVIEFLERARLDSPPEAGYVTVFVSGADGASLTAEEKEPIQSGISDKVVVGLQILVKDAITVNIEANMTIKVLPGYDATTVQTNVDTFLQEILSPNEWGWLPRIRRNVLIARAAQVVGVEYVESFNFVLTPGEFLAELDAITGDVVFIYEGTLPITAVNISVL